MLTVRQAREVLGTPADPMREVERRARDALPGVRLIVWQGDAQTFRHTYVGGDVVEILGYPLERWTEEPAFWAEQVVHPLDRGDATAWLALATGQRLDHAFEYRAQTMDDRVVWLFDFVRVLMGNRGMAVTLRGLRVDITDVKRRSGDFHCPPRVRRPPRPSLSELL